MKLFRVLLKVLLVSSELSQGLVIPGASSTKAISSHNAASREVNQHDFDPIFPRAGTCPKVTLIKGKKCARAVGAKNSGACLPPSSSKNPTVAPKSPGQTTKVSPKPKSSKKPSKKSSTRGLEAGVAALTFEERTDQTLIEMNEISSFKWEVGDTAETIGLDGCSVIALYNDKAIVWGHYSPVITRDNGEGLDYKQTLSLALGKIESKARSMGILETGRAKGVVRVDRRAAAWNPLPGEPKIALIILNWFLKLGVSDCNRATYNGENLVKGSCTIKHATLGNVEVRMA